MRIVRIAFVFVMSLVCLSWLTNAMTLPLAEETEPMLLKNINTQVTAVAPQVLTAIRNTIFYGIDGYLWQSDGTVTGTAVITELIGKASHSTNVNDTLFYARNGIDGELWRSNGTPESTYLVRRFEGMLIQEIAQVHDVLFLIIGDSETNELWRTDGTDAGTQLVRNVFHDGYEVQLQQLTAVNDTLYFFVHEILSENGVRVDAGSGLWRSNGTLTGTTEIASFYHSTYAYFAESLTAVNDQLFFSARDPLNQFGKELWRSDGTPGGTMMVKDIHESGNASPKSLTAVSNLLYFTAWDASHGWALWRSDGTETGTFLVKDPSPEFSGLDNFNSVNDLLFFIHNDDVYGRELWVSDGTENGTQRLTDINPGPEDSFHWYYTYFAPFDDQLFIMRQDRIYDTAPSLWKSDGTVPGTVQVKEFYQAHAEELALLAAQDYLVAVVLNSNNENGSWYEMWHSEGTTDTTHLLQAFDLLEASSNPRNFLSHKGAVLFRATEKETESPGIWYSDGTFTNTFKAPDYVQYPATFYQGTGLYLTASLDNNALLLQRSANLLGQPRLVKEIPWYSGFPESTWVEAGSFQFFSISYQDPDGWGTPYYLWRTDGTELGTSYIGEFSLDYTELTAVGMAVYFAKPGRLWRINHFDGEAETVKMFSEGQSPTQLTPLNGTLLFTTSQPPRLWGSNGTEVGTEVIKTFEALDEYARLEQLTAVNDSLFFVLIPNLNSTEATLWQSNGTPGGTTPIRTFIGNDYVQILHLTAWEDQLFFMVDSSGERSFWRSDGTLTNTTQLANFPYFWANSSEYWYDSGLQIYRDKLFFEIWQNGEVDSQWWASDGTITGTIPVTSTLPGNVPLQSCDFPTISCAVEADGRFFFAGTDAENGQEPWVYAPPGLRVLNDYIALNEGAGNAVYALTLNTQPTYPVSVTIQPDAQTEVLPNTVVFTTNNWNKPQTVTVTAVDDAYMEHIHQSRVRHLIHSNDPNYQNIWTESIIVHIQDNDFLYFPLIMKEVNETFQ